MAIRYEYNSECCNNLYIEVRNIDDPQIKTKCNDCTKGDYILVNEVEIETIPTPIYQALDQPAASAKDKFLAAGFTLEEINLLVQEETYNI